MEITERIIKEIESDTIKNRFVGSWHIEGTEAEKEKLCASILKHLKNQQPKISCIKLRRYPANIDFIQLGKKYCESARLYLLSVEIGQKVNPSFGAIPKTK